VLRGGKGSGAAGVIGQFLYGDAPLDQWVARGAGPVVEPWSSFERARQLFHKGRQDEAVRIWRQTAATSGLESRQTLQAWHFLRQAGEEPGADTARTVLGAVAEMPVGNAHDILAAYSDGTARYLNYSGKALIWEAPSDAGVSAAISDWLSSGQVIAASIGTWDQPSLPPVPAGHMRLAVLTPGGVRFGQGPADVMQREPIAGAFLIAATRLLQLLTELAHPDAT